MKKFLFIACLSFQFCVSHAQTNVADSLALVDLYWATDGPNWTNKSNWLTGPVSTWFGISKAGYDTTRVLAINLNSNNLSGTIPSSIGNLTHIRELYLWSNNLTGTIPQTIGRLVELQVLFLTQNNLSGNLTDSVAIPSLYTIHLSYNNFVGSVPASLNQLPHLTLFTIYNNQFDDLPDFSGIPNTMGVTYDVHNNFFTFEDLEPNMTIGCFYCCNQMYISPQFDSINSTIDTTVQEHTAFEIHCSIGGQHNLYQWTKNGVDIPLATDSVLAFSSIALGDSGVYSCRVINSIVPNLTYHRRVVTVHVDKLTESLEYDKLAATVFNVYPTPATNLFTIESPVTNATLSISNLLGQEVLRQEVMEKQFDVDVSSLGIGVYFVHLRYEKGMVVRKVVIER